MLYRKNKKISVRKELFIVFGGFIILMILSILMFNSFFLKDYNIHVTSKKMKTVSDLVSEKYKESKTGFIQFLSECEKDWNLTIKVVDKNYNVRYSSERKAIKQSDVSDRVLYNLKAYKDDLNRGEEILVKLHDLETNVETKLLCMSRLDDGKTLIIFKTIKSIEENVQISNQFFILISTGFIVIGLIIIWIFSAYITNNIRNMSKVANDIKNLQFDSRIEIKSNDEIGELGMTINTLSDRLSESIEAMKHDIQRRKQMVRDMSHELKTPIASIKGYTEALQYGVATDEQKVNEYYEIIVEECNRMEDLVKEMLQLSKTEASVTPIKYRQIDSMKFMDNIRKHFGNMVKKKKVELECQDQIRGIFYGDLRLVERAVFNYIDNAIRYCNQRIVVGFRVIKAIDENEAVNLLKSEIAQKDLKQSDGVQQLVEDEGRLCEYIAITVYNDGKKIAEEKENELWEAFYKEEQSRKRNENHNYGLGLSIVKSIAERHKGAVFFKNNTIGVTFGILIKQKNNEI